jgi:hypothetical protein
VTTAQQRTADWWNAPAGPWLDDAVAGRVMGGVWAPYSSDRASSLLVVDRLADYGWEVTLAYIDPARTRAVGRDLLCLARDPARCWWEVEGWVHGGPRGVRHLRERHADLPVAVCYAGLAAWMWGTLP